MQRRSQAQWRALFSAQRMSGLSAAAYCREQQLCPKYFSLRRRQLQADGDAGRSAIVPAFMPVAATRSVEIPSLDVHLGATRRLRVPSSVAPHRLAALLTSLRA